MKKKLFEFFLNNYVILNILIKKKKNLMLEKKVIYNYLKS